MGPVRAAVENQTVVIAEGRIQAIGDAASIRIPDDAEILELQGHTVIPGIVGMHEHLFYPAGSNPALYPTLGVTFPRLYLANGVTTMRTGAAWSPTWIRTSSGASMRAEWWDRRST